MPFLKGVMPIRRTMYYLEKGDIFLRKEVRVVAIGYNTMDSRHSGARDFVFWNWAQLQYKNQTVQLVKLKTCTPNPYIMAYLDDGKEVMLDLFDYTRKDISDRLKRVLGKTDLILENERVSDLQMNNPANFGEKFRRQCICEVQGQMPCPSVVCTPKFLSGNWRWNVKATQN